MRGSTSGQVKRPTGLPARIDPLTTLLCHGSSNTVWFSAPARHRGFRQPRAGFETRPPIGQQSEWSWPGERRSRSGGSRRPGQPARKHGSQRWSGSTDRTARPVRRTAFGCERPISPSSERFWKTIQRIQSTGSAPAGKWRHGISPTGGSPAAAGQHGIGSTDRRISSSRSPGWG
jgi:hypothetical protein